ncbi:hypothetical protein RZE82_00290 [Mollicutes bacterium LVI A0039]|nr:hypothetical protein RZE82_00290 [Mollicutes bacterium LVI A0039]
MRKKFEINESKYYLNDDQKEVIKYYKKYYPFYDEKLYGGETIFSINTILYELCALLEKETTIAQLAGRQENKTIKLLTLDAEIVNNYPLPDLNGGNYSNFDEVLGKISSKRSSRFIVVMNSKELPEEFKSLLIYYVFTIRKLGNYMPLLKLRMNGKFTGKTNTINQRKGNFNTYKDDPIKFYSALTDYIDDASNIEFKNELCDKYKGNNNDLNDFFELNYLNSFKQYLHQEDKYLVTLLNSNLNGLYEYMWRACQIINKRHNEIFYED